MNDLAAARIMEATEGVERELMRLNGHLEAYLECMAQNILAGPCSGSRDEAWKVQQAAAHELLRHLREDEPR